MLDTVGLEFVRVGSAEDLVASDFGGDNLGDDIAVGEADDQAVLGSVILVLGLGDETLSGVVVGLTRPTTLVLGLVATVMPLVDAIKILNRKYSPIVRAVLNQLGERLCSNPRVSNLRFRFLPKHLAKTW